jgi:hypothetical protein
MTQIEATDMATQLLATYGLRGFEISMPDKVSYDIMRATLLDMGRESGPDGEFFVIKVFPANDIPTLTLA